MDADWTGDRVLQNVVVAKQSESYPRIPVAQLCAIAFTSGSTGAPAPNHKSWGALRSGSLNNKRLILGDLTEGIHLIATVPAQHMWGFEASVLLPLFSDAAVGNACPFFPHDIVYALEKIPQPRGLISSPTHLDVISRSGVQLPDIKRIFTATSPLSRTLASQLEDAFDTEVLEVFGSSESGMIATRRTAIEELWSLSADFELVPGEGGFELHAEHLPASVHIPDIVEMVGERQFRWLGRHQDVVNIAGKRGSFGDLNKRLLAVSGVDDGVIFLPENREDRLAALVVAPDLSASDIVAALRPQIDPVFLPRSIFLVEALPRQESGKLASSAVNALFLKLQE
jgi:acyl-coenzyme A synthetase/AMP-(fatty) acid ligase